jgi:hypothetical protein
MKNYLLIISSMLVLLASCDRYFDPGYEYLENDQFHFSQPASTVFFAGEAVSDSILFNARSYINGRIKEFTVEFDVISGGGSVTKASAVTDPSGNVYTGWKLGYTSFQQRLRASVFDQNGYYLSSSYLTAYGFRNNAWDTCSFTPDGSIESMVSDRAAGVTFMISGGKVYKQGVNYFSWEKVMALSSYSAFAIDMDGNNVIFLTTWQGEVLKSTDHGATWNMCTRPYPEDPYYVYTTISNDNSIWAFKWNYPTKISSDGGITWRDAGGPISAGGVGDAYRMADGSIIFHGGNCCSLFRSTDNGASWYHIITPGYSTKVYADGLNTIYVVTQEIGIAFYKSEDFGATFKKIHSVYPNWGTTRKHKMFQLINGSYWILVPGYGIVKSKDLVSFEDYWVNNNLTDLFIDHNGVIIARDWDNKTVYYRKNSATK